MFNALRPGARVYCTLVSRACLFCGAVGNFTDEHVIPEWLLKYLNLPEDDQLFQGVASTETGNLKTPA
jgi:hypothetical protein